VISAERHTPLPEIGKSCIENCIVRCVVISVRLTVVMDTAMILIVISGAVVKTIVAVVCSLSQREFSVRPTCGLNVSCVALQPVCTYIGVQTRSITQVDLSG
jgi:hypothetical protein